MKVRTGYYITLKQIDYLNGQAEILFNKLFEKEYYSSSLKNTSFENCSKEIFLKYVEKEIEYKNTEIFLVYFNSNLDSPTGIVMCWNKTDSYEIYNIILLSDNRNKIANLEISKIIIDYNFTNLKDIKRIEMTIDSRNTEARESAVVEIGFDYKGSVKEIRQINDSIYVDLDYYMIYRDEWYSKALPKLVNNLYSNINRSSSSEE